MEYVQKVKGTKVVVTLFSAKVGDDMPEDPIYDIGNSSDEAVVRPAIRKYAEAIYDAVVAAGYDGYDWDYELVREPEIIYGQTRLSGEYLSKNWAIGLVQVLKGLTGTGGNRLYRDFCSL